MSGPVTDPAGAWQQREDDLQEIIDTLAGPNPHAADMALPAALFDDGGTGR
jgi:hypothetical protein